MVPFLCLCAGDFVPTILLGVIRTFMVSAKQINQSCARFLRWFFFGVFCLAAGYVGLILLICGPFAWPILGAWILGVVWIIVKLIRRFRLYDHDA